MNKISILVYWQMSNSINHTFTMICPYMTDLNVPKYTTFQNEGPMRHTLPSIGKWASVQGPYRAPVPHAHIITKYLKNMSV